MLQSILKTNTVTQLTFLKYSSAMYMIFCGAPGHLIGGGGKVKMAFPDLKSCIAGNVLVTVWTVKLLQTPGLSNASGSPLI